MNRLERALRWVWTAPARYVAWARPRFIWRHQVAQVVITAAGGALLWRVGAGWSSVIILVAVSTLIAVDAGVEGRHAERRRRPRELPGVHVNG